MVRRTLVSLTAAALLALVGRAGAGPLASQAVAARNAALSSGTSAAPTPVTVEWVFHAGDLLTCRTSAVDLRHARARFGSQVHIQVVAVDADADYVGSFMRTERLDAPVTFLSERDFKRRYRNLLTPAVLVGQAEDVREVFASGNLTPASRRSAASMLDFIESLLRPPVARQLARTVN